MTARNLRLGDASVDVLIRRSEDGVLVDVLRREGAIEVVKTML